MSRPTETGFINHYRCDCGEEWSDEWSCACDDDCPSCGTTCSPHESDVEGECEDADAAE